MLSIRTTVEFDKWFARLRDRKAKTRVQVRIDRLETGHFGDVKPIGEGVSELRISYGPGYRVYLVQKGQVLVVLLCGGDKSSQSRDIQQAKQLADEIKGEL